jgi:hypothetical protein
MSKQADESAPLLHNEEEEDNASEIDYNDLSVIPPREWLRLNIGGLLFIGLGVYIIYRTVLTVGTLFIPISLAVRPLPAWNTTRYAFILSPPPHKSGADLVVATHIRRLIMSWMGRLPRNQIPSGIHRIQATQQQVVQTG